MMMPMVATPKRHAIGIQEASILQSLPVKNTKSPQGNRAGSVGSDVKDDLQA
jgi:hypothetical protein